MDKNAIKKFAVWARTELIARVSLKGVEYGITEDNIMDAAADSIHGSVLSGDEKKQRQALIAEINEKGYQQVMEEVAYTWFNRFSALRFMEVNGYLPSHVRVFTDEENNFKPQIITEAIHLDLDGLDMEKVYALKEAEKTEELYKYLLIVQCNALNAILPGMFQKIADYTELLLPDNLLREGSVIQQMIELIPEEDWKDAVQIIGWLYQYYNSEKKDDVFAALKKNVKITKENIPAATQLFTPDWIVRYMVENSLGRLWVEGHPNDELKSQWKYYLEEAEQEPEVLAQLAEIRKEYAALTPDQLKVIDPCSGSGHILAYMFDVLMQIYESYGYTTREAVASIVENNLYGLDIDDRAAQLAYFSVMMKARQYDRRFFSRGIQPHVYAIAESNHADQFAVDYFCNGDAKLTAAMDTIISELNDAKEYGSILTVTPQDWAALYARFAEIKEDIHISREAALRELLPLVQTAEALAQKYDVVVTNPPYMGASGMSTKLSDYVKTNYPDVKSDMSTVCMEKTIAMCKQNGYMAMINIPVWMFISSYETLRYALIKNNRIVSMIHPGRGIFGSDFGTTSFVIGKNYIKDYKASYYRLFEKQGDVETPEVRERAFLKHVGQNYASQDMFLKIPGQPIAYWLKNIEIFDFPNLGKYIDARIGMVSGDNERFLRFWFEVLNPSIEYGACPNSDPMVKKWYPLQKGGDFRKWYGNISYVVNWENDGYELKFNNYMGKRVRSHNYNGVQQFKEGITWNSISASKFHCRYSPTGFTYDAAGPLCEVTQKGYLWTVLGFLSTKVAEYIFSIINPTINFPSGYLESLPFAVAQKERVDEIVKQCVKSSKDEWDSFETSWDFRHHPLLRKVSTIAEAFDQWQTECDDRFNQLKANEEELNRIFIDIYGLQDELTPEVEDKDVTVRKADLGRDIRSFISYAVGCMFGRYSLYKDGLIFAGEPYSLEAWVNKMNDQPGTISHKELVRAYCNEGITVNEMFFPDEDNIIPVCDDEYFKNDDIVGRFVDFVETVYGADTRDENLQFIADALGGKGQPKAVIRKYFLNDFYKDHCKMYQKRPIYWLFDSGKKNGFKCLIYMHRYQPDTIARIRTDYVHEQQARYRTAIADREQRIANAAAGERVKLKKELTALQAQDAEIRTYEEKIHHLADQMISIDLDDGVKKNYAIFKDVLAKIK